MPRRDRGGILVQGVKVTDLSFLDEYRAHTTWNTKHRPSVALILKAMHSFFAFALI